jgi:hypothetical protein
VNPSQLPALFRRHLVAVLAVIILAVGVGLDIKTTPPAYEEGATIVFMAPGANPYSTLGHELIPVASLMTATITSPEYLGKIRAAGGTADPSIAMVNLYSEQFPQYGVPYITISTESSDAAAVGRTFNIIVNMLRDLVSTRQAQAGVPRWSFISIRVIGDSGIQVPWGSRIRVLFGLSVLALIALFMVVMFLDRRTGGGQYDRRLPAGLRTRMSSLIT